MQARLTQEVIRRVVIAGEEREVKLLSPSADFRVLSFDGLTLEVFLGDARAKDRFILIDGRPFRVRLVSRRRGSCVMEVGGERIEVSLLAQGPKPIQDVKGAETVTSTRVSTERVTSIRAHMSGRISAVKVGPSDKVEGGTPMFVLVAMKMENTIVSPNRGIVREVRVIPGASVNKGDVLAIIE